MGSENNAGTVFRCNGSFETGLGHLARCAVLTRRLPGVANKFIIGSDSLAEDFLRSKKIDFHLLPGIQSERKEASLVAEIAQQLKTQHVVLDKKDNSRAYLEVLKKAGLLVIDIEDRGEGRLLADILIDPHIWPESEEAACEGPSFCGFGPDWVLLDPIYARLRHRRRRDNKIEKPNSAVEVVVSCGGSDPAGLTGRVLEVLAGRAEKLRVTVVQGPGAKERPLSCGPHELRIVRGAASGLARILYCSDLAVVSGGITMCECMCLGLATVFVPQHEEQAVNAGHFADRGGLLLAPLPQDADFTPRLEESIDKVLTDKTTRRELSRTGAGLVDGLGIARMLLVLESDRIKNCGRTFRE